MMDGPAAEEQEADGPDDGGALHYMRLCRRPLVVAVLPCLLAVLRGSEVVKAASVASLSDHTEVSLSVTKTGPYCGQASLGLPSFLIEMSSQAQSCRAMSGTVGFIRRAVLVTSWSDGCDRGAKNLADSADEICRASSDLQHTVLTFCVYP